MLYDISGIRTGWGKINKGMIKMYNAEVLSKFPVVQHFRFGFLFSFDQDPDAIPPPTSVHAANQPIRDGFGSLEAEKIAASRAPPQPGTQAPWASQATSVPGTAGSWARKAPPRPNPAGATVGTAAPWAQEPTTMIDPADGNAAPRAVKGTPSSGAESGTVAPWVSRQPTVLSAGLPPTRFPQSGTRPTPANAGVSPQNANDGDSAAAAQSMPPSTRVPRTKLL